MFLAVLFLSIVIALVQTQATGTVAAAEDGSPVIGASIKPKSVIVYSNIFYTFAFVNDTRIQLASAIGTIVCCLSHR